MDNENRKSFGEFIAGRRRALGMTQREFADRLFVTGSAVSKWERGRELPRYNPHPRHMRDPRRERARAAHRQRGRGGQKRRKARRALQAHGAQLQARAVRALRRRCGGVRHQRPRLRRRPELVAHRHRLAADRRKPHAAARARARAHGRRLGGGRIHPLAHHALRRHLPCERRQMVRRCGVLYAAAPLAAVAAVCAATDPAAGLPQLAQGAAVYRCEHTFAARASFGGVPAHRRGLVCARRAVGAVRAVARARALRAAPRPAAGEAEGAQNPALFSACLPRCFCFRSA